MFVPSIEDNIAVENCCNEVNMNNNKKCGSWKREDYRIDLNIDVI